MKIVVISLRSSAARRANIRRQLDAIGLPFEFFDAVEGDGSLAHIHHFDGREFFLNTGRAAAAKDIARYSSHVGVWRQCADDGQAVLVLEDDVRLGLAFRDGARAIEKVVNRFGFVRASTPTARSSFCVDRLRSFELRCCRRVPAGLLGYAISPAAAERMADAAMIVEEPIDRFIQRFWRHGQPIYTLLPVIVYQHAIADTADVNTEVRPPCTFTMWLARAGRKLSDALQRGRFSLALYTALALPVLVSKLELLQLAGRRAG